MLTERYLIKEEIFGKGNSNKDKRECLPLQWREHSTCFTNMQSSEKNKEKSEVRRWNNEKVVVLLELQHEKLSSCINNNKQQHKKQINVNKFVNFISTNMQKFQVFFMITLISVNHHKGHKQHKKKSNSDRVGTVTHCIVSTVSLSCQGYASLQCSSIHTICFSQTVSQVT